MIKKELVIIKDFKGYPLIRRIWKIDNRAIYVTDDMRKGIVSIGFPREDVFKYDPKLAASMEQLYKSGKWDWSKLVPY